MTLSLFAFEAKRIPRSLHLDEAVLLPARAGPKACNAANLDARHARRTSMTDSEASGFELLLSDPELLAWLEPEDGEDEEDD
jgi:hypothetical protein